MSSLELPYQPDRGPVGRPPPETIEPGGNIAVFFTHWVERAPDRPALVFPRREGDRVAYEVLTFADLDRDANRLAHALTRQGVRQGDRVLILIPMSRPLYALLVAVMKLGATAVFLDPWVTPDQMADAAERVRPRVFAGVPRAHLLRLASPAFSRIPIKLVAGAGAWSRLLGRRVEVLAASGPEQFTLARCGLDDTVLITFTTGSTGRPKGSNRTERFLNAQGAALDRHLTRIPGDVDMPALPVFVLNNLGAGVPSVLPLVDFRRISAVEPRLVVQEIEDWRVSTIGGSPAYLLPIARWCLEQGRVLSTVRGVVAGGAPVPPALLRMLQEVCPSARGAIEVLYGSTEAEPVARIEADEVLRRTAALTEQGRGNCVGRPVPDVRLRIVRADPRPWQLEGRPWSAVEVAPGEVGEVLLTGEHVQKDYLDDPEAVRKNKVVGPDGEVWHRMGDLAYQDAEGRLWLVGRLGEAIVRPAGPPLLPIPVEGRAEAVPGVRKAGLVALGERAVLALAPGPDAEPGLTRRVDEACRAAGFLLDEVRLVEQIPLDPRHNAKVDRRALEQLLRGE